MVIYQEDLVYIDFNAALDGKLMTEKPESGEITKSDGGSTGVERAAGPAGGGGFRLGRGETRVPRPEILYRVEKCGDGGGLPGRGVLAPGSWLARHKEGGAVLGPSMPERWAMSLVLISKGAEPLLFSEKPVVLPGNRREQFVQ